MIPHHRRRGQSLAEILVVVAIISIVLGCLMPAIAGMMKAVDHLRHSVGK